MVSQRQALHVTSVRPRACFVPAAEPTGQSQPGRVKTEACASPEVWSATQSAGPYCPWPRASEPRFVDDIRADSSASSAQWGSPVTARGLFTSMLSMFCVSEVSSATVAVATLLSELTWNVHPHACS